MAEGQPVYCAKEFVQKILCLYKSFATPRDQGLSQETNSQTGLACPRISDEDDFLGPIQEQSDARSMILDSLTLRLPIKERERR